MRAQRVVVARFASPSASAIDLLRELARFAHAHISGSHYREPAGKVRKMWIALPQLVRFVGVSLNIFGQAGVELPEARLGVRFHRAKRPSGVNSIGLVRPARNSVAASRAIARSSSRDVANC